MSVVRNGSHPSQHPETTGARKNEPHQNPLARRRRFARACSDAGGGARGRQRRQDSGRLASGQAPLTNHRMDSPPRLPSTLDSRQQWARLTPSHQHQLDSSPRRQDGNHCRWAIAADDSYWAARGLRGNPRVGLGVRNPPVAGTGRTRSRHRRQGDSRYLRRCRSQEEPRGQ